MIYTDTHTHLYLNAFDEDRDAAVSRAVAAGVTTMLLPNIDSSSIAPMLALCDRFPDNCLPMMGLHPTSVKENYREELKNVEDALDKREFIAIGEIGIDLYWDKSFFNEQKEAFTTQLEIALDLDLPVAIHTRESMDETLEILGRKEYQDVRGVLHCFSGTAEQAQKVVDMGFYLGIGVGFRLGQIGRAHV